MNRQILIPLLSLSVFLLSAETTKRDRAVSIVKEVQKMNHTIERKEIEANCYANETSKAKQDFYIETQTMSPETASKLVKLFE